MLCNLTMKALVLVTCVVAALAEANHPGSHHNHHMGHYVHSVSYKLPGASFFSIKQVFPTFHHGGHHHNHHHQMEHNHSSQAALVSRGRTGRVNNFNPFNPRYSVSSSTLSPLCPNLYTGYFSMGIWLYTINGRGLEGLRVVHMHETVSFFFQIVRLFL